MPDARFRYWLNRYLAVALAAFLTSALILGNSLFTIYRGDLESRFAPVFVDRTHIDWRREADGSWSAVVFIYKRRGSCVYVKDQIETAIAVIPGGEIVEAPISYINDPTPGSNRPRGWQRLDSRVHFNSPEIVSGSILRGSVLHQCGGDGRLTVTEWGPVIVGEDQDLPDYVLAWVENNRIGTPDDYR